MPRGKEFCPFENDFFEPSEFELVDGILLHNRRHRATDGIPVKIGDGKVEPINDTDIGTTPLFEKAVE